MKTQQLTIDELKYVSLFFLKQYNQCNQIKQKFPKYYENEEPCIALYNLHNQYKEKYKCLSLDTAISSYIIFDTHGVGFEFK
jgi:hypothetical protein